MTYEEAYAAIDQIKWFTKTRRQAQDKRHKTFELLDEQMADAYRVACVVKNHIQVAERYDKAKGK